jgi:hypothetical protein
MVQVEVNSSSNINESVQGQPVSQIPNGMTQKNPNQKKQEVISSTDLPSEANLKEKKEMPSEEGVEKKPSRWWLWLIIILFILGGLAAVYFLILKDKLFAGV